MKLAGAEFGQSSHAGNLLLANCAKTFPSLSRPRGGKTLPLDVFGTLFGVELMVTKRQLGFGDREAAGCAGDAVCGGVERARLPSIGQSKCYCGWFLVTGARASCDIGIIHG